MVGTVLLDGLMEPRDFRPALQTALATSANAPAPPEIAQTIRKAAQITVYFTDPIAGLVVGLFVGLLQKKRAVTVALIALMPNFLIDLTPAHIGNWPQSTFGAAHYLVDRSFPFIAATLGVMLIRHLRSNSTSEEVHS